MLYPIKCRPVRESGDFIRTITNYEASGFLQSLKEHINKSINTFIRYHLRKPASTTDRDRDTEAIS